MALVTRLYFTTRCSFLLALACCALAPGCSSDEHMRQVQTPLTTSDAGEAADASYPDDELEAKLTSIELSPKDAQEEALWENAPEFELSFEATRCLGLCPSYEYRVDQSGLLHFEGKQYVARPGSYDTTVSNAWQSSLLFNSIRQGFLRLGDRFAEEADGCLVATDNPTYKLRIALPDRSKEITYYAGCLFKGPAYSALRSIVDGFKRWIAERSFTEPNPKECASKHALEPALGSSYELRDAQNQPAGLLRIDAVAQESPRSRSWRVLTCTGEELFGGRLSRHGCNAVLLPNPGESTFSFPGIERPMNAAIVQRHDTAAESVELLDLRVLDAASEVSVRARAANACSR